MKRPTKNADQVRLTRKSKKYAEYSLRRAKDRLLECGASSD